MLEDDTNRDNCSHPRGVCRSCRFVCGYHVCLIDILSYMKYWFLQVTGDMILNTQSTTIPVLHIHTQTK